VTIDGRGNEKVSTTPDGMQRLFTTARWDEDLASDDVRGYVRLRPSHARSGTRQSRQTPHRGRSLKEGAVDALPPFRDSRPLPASAVGRHHSES
jgi:hypothetical protein